MSILKQLSEQFQNRHNGPTRQEIKEMLKTIGVESPEQLIDQVVPEDIRLQDPLDLPSESSETQVIEEVKKLAQNNKVFKSYIGLGYYDTYTPGVIQRNVLENPGWYTAYTPYQAEISQGRLNALINFQTMVCDLTGMEIANASLLDEGTAAGEAMTMFRNLQKRKNGDKFFVSEKVFPQTIEVLKTRAKPAGIEVITGDHNKTDLDDSYFGALVQFPDEEGNVHDYKQFVKKAKEQNILVAVAADLLSLVLLTPPGDWGADCVVGSTQRFGIPMGYGGPHAAYFATHDKYKRRVPGRIIGISKDSQGNNAARMALQTREQHIRRERATSNICTAQVLLANMAAFYAIYHGPEGLKTIAKRIHLLTKALDKGLQKLGYHQTNQQYFDTLNIDLGDEFGDLQEKIKIDAEALQVNFRYKDNRHIGISIDETKTEEDLEELLDIFTRAKSENNIETRKILEQTNSKPPAKFARKSSFLTHTIFNSLHSETKMLRYLKFLENKDLSLVHSMIPLGSCTMKLNATTEMIPLSWAEFHRIHPFVPKNQVKGYRILIEKLSDQLRAITGFPGISNQPNSGAQGEFTGLMVIRKYLEDKGEGHRDVALIPSSAHGTNPASAVMAGLNVVVVQCDDHGNIDIGDLREKAQKYTDRLAALMITYPSTHGVYEETIREVCGVIHQNGGQVYMDGANLNAQLGLSNPALIGSDICHLNLHKTFTIPHGGGGPGMGPIAAAKHLTPYLPGHIFSGDNGEKNLSAIASAPFGSASILVISYIFNRLMGSEGLTQAGILSILNTNYIKARLEKEYQVLYTGKNGYAAHEMILDTRPFKASGITVEDIAKRLMDYGFHAPTMSFPVPETLMVEPTESESKDELDRFCEAMLNIKKEIDEVALGDADKEDNVLKNAPHTIQMVSANSWEHPYSREKAVYPLDWLKVNKFWASTGRVDSSYGDRHLYCSCPPMNEYLKEEPIAD